MGWEWGGYGGLRASVDFATLTLSHMFTVKANMSGLHFFSPHAQLDAEITSGQRAVNSSLASPFFYFHPGGSKRALQTTYDMLGEPT